MTRCCVECETDQAIEALRAPGSPVEPLDPHEETCDHPFVALRGLLGPPSGISAPVLSPHVRHHAFGCAAPCRGGACDCAETVRPTDVRTSSRGFSYELVQMLGDGWWPEEEEA